MSKTKIHPKLDALVNLGIDIKLLIEDSKFGNDFQCLSKKAYGQLWDLLLNAISKLIVSEAEEQPKENALLETMLFVEKALRSDPARAGTSSSFISLVSILNVTSQLSQDCKSILCKINELWLKNELPPVQNMIKFTMNYLLSLVQSAEKPLVADAKRLYSFRNQAPIEIVEENQTLINDLIIKKTYISLELGQKFLGFVASLSEPLLTLLFNTMKYELRTCSKKFAENYGAIMLITWYNAQNEVKLKVKARFQDLMECLIKVPRKGLELPDHGRNLMIVISNWNVEMRKKGNSNFIGMMTECYQPIIWKFLQSGLNFERCNAADLFMKAFPLQIPDDPNEDADLFLKQLHHMEDILRDDCHITRMIAVREICNILSVYWTQFSSAQIRKLLMIILNEHAADTASYEVRKTVWRGLQSFIESEPAYEYMKQFLPDLERYYNDCNQRVRIEFIELLYAIREKKDKSFKYIQVVSRTKLLTSLAYENGSVGSAIVKLLLPSFYVKEMDQTQWIKSFCWLIKTHPESYRNFFMFSKKRLPFEDAHLIMCELITYLGGYVMKKAAVIINEDRENDENDSSVGNVQNQSIFDQNRSSVLPGERECAFDDPDIVVGLFDIITILWIVNNDSLLNIENRSKLQKLHETYMRFAPSFVSYYKGSDLFHSVVTLSGNVPAPILINGSITLPGYCLNRLKTTKINCSPMEDAENLSMLVALVKWGKGALILEHILLWLQDAFDSYYSSLNERIKRVRIKETIEPNSELAVHLLNLLLRTEYTRSDVLRKNHSQLLEVWNIMSPIKELVFQRLLQGRPFSQPLLSDSFLEACFKRYVKLIPVLYRNEPVKTVKEEDEGKQAEDEANITVAESVFNAQTELCALLQWTKDDLIPMLQSDDCTDLPLLSSLLNEILYVSDNMIMVQIVDIEIISKLGAILISALNMEYNLHFIKAASRVATAINFFGKVRFCTLGHDDIAVWSRIVPSIMFHTINAMVSRPHSSATLEPFKQDLRELKINFTKIFKTYEENYKLYGRSKEKLSILRLFMLKMMQAVRVVLGRDIPNENMSVTVYSSFQKLHPSVAIVLSFFYDKPFWTPLFLNFLKQNLGETAKMLLVDITVLYLFAKCENRKWHFQVNEVLREATLQLKSMRSHRASGEVESLGLTLTHADDAPEEMGGDLPTSQVTSAAAIAEGTDSGAGTGSNPGSNIATIATESCTSEPMECDDVLPQSGASTSQPLSQPSQPLSNVATQGSQPNQQTQDPPPTSRKLPITEDSLFDDFIEIGVEMLNAIKGFITKPPESENKSKSEVAA